MTSCSLVVVAMLADVLWPEQVGLSTCIRLFIFTWLLRCCFDHRVVAEEMQGDLAVHFCSLSQLPIPSASYVIGFLVKVKVNDTHMLF